MAAWLRERAGGYVPVRRYRLTLPRRFWMALAKGCLIYALSMLLWMLIGEQYTSYFRRSLSFFTGRVGTEGIVELLPPQASGPHDVSFRLRKEGAILGFRHSLSTKYTAYQPTVILMTLVLCTPIPGRRKGFALVCGLLLIHFFIASRVAISLYARFLTVDYLALVHVGEFARHILVSIGIWIGTSPTTSLLVAGLVWVLVTLQRSDLDGILRRSDSQVLRFQTGSLARAHTEM